MLTAQHIFLRELRSSDVEIILKWENNPENWEVSGTTEPFTKLEIERLVNTKEDLEINQQIRYVICLTSSQTPIGTLDLFEFDDQIKKVGVGILIAEKENRQKGYATEALNSIIDYCRNELSIVTIFCNIQKDNNRSIRLFEKCGFQFIEERTLFENEVNYYELKK